MRFRRVKRIGEIAFGTEHAFRCSIWRNHLGVLCGYIGISQGHPWFGMDYVDIRAECHGGLTFSALEADGFPHDTGFNLWWIGFDCAHDWDGVPGLGKKGEVRDEKYVRGEITKLIHQAREVVMRERGHNWAHGIKCKAEA